MIHGDRINNTIRNHSNPDLYNYFRPVWQGEEKIMELFHALELKGEALTQNLIKEVQIMNDKLRDPDNRLVPLGLGSLQKSFRVKIEDTPAGKMIGIYSKSPYALKHNYVKMMHLPKDIMGMKSFSDYAIGFKPRKSSKFPPRLQRYKYGLKLAREGRIPSAIYNALYIQRIIEMSGGWDGILRRAKESL